MLKKEPVELTREGVNKCFGCGQDNPIGLKLRFHYDKDRAEAEFTPEELHQGWPGIVHGGIIFTLLDEAMGYALYPQQVNCVTAKAEARFRRPAMIGETLVVSSEVTRKTKRLVEVKASIALKDGTIVAEGTALMYVIGREK